MKKMFILAIIMFALFFGGCSAQENAKLQQEIGEVQEFLNIYDVSIIESFALYPRYPFNEQSNEWDYIVTHIQNRKEGILTDSLAIEISPDQDIVGISYSPEFAEKEISKASSTFLSSFTEVYDSSKESQIYFMKDYLKALEFSAELSENTVNKYINQHPFNEQYSEWDYIINYIIFELNEKENQLPYKACIRQSGNNIIFELSYEKSFSGDL